MKKNRKKKWLGFALVLTIIAVGAASLTAFGADGRGTAYQSKMQQKQTICPINQDCFQRGVHHTGRSSAVTSPATADTSNTGTSTSATYGSCRYPDCDGTHANHQNYNYGNHNYGNHNYGHHGSAHRGGHGWHE